MIKMDYRLESGFLFSDLEEGICSFSVIFPSFFVGGIFLMR